MFFFFVQVFDLAGFWTFQVRIPGCFHACMNIVFFLGVDACEPSGTWQQGTFVSLLPRPGALPEARRGWESLLGCMSRVHQVFGSAEALGSRGAHIAHAHVCCVMCTLLVFFSGAENLSLQGARYSAPSTPFRVKQEGEGALAHSHRT